MCHGQMPYPDSYVEQDLNGFIGNTSLYSRNCRLYIDPKTYPPPTGQEGKKLSGENIAIFERLRKDLQMTALRNNQNIACNGSQGRKLKPKSLRVFVTESTLVEVTDR
jgi:hypothetical protein